MPFMITKKFKTNIQYPDYGILTEGPEVEVNVTFECTTIISMDRSGSCLATLSVEIEGVESSAMVNYQFYYSGSGNPFDEAEEEYKKHLEGI